MLRGSLGGRISALAYLFCATLLISASPWYDLGVRDPDEPFSQLYDTSTYSRGLPCNECSHDSHKWSHIHNRWQDYEQATYRDAHGQICWRVSFQGPAVHADAWTGPSGMDYPNCQPGCCSRKIRAIFCSLFYYINDHSPYGRLRKGWSGDIPEEMLPSWGGYYWHYDIALSACEQYVWDEWDSAIKRTEEDYDKLLKYQDGYYPCGFAWTKRQAIEPKISRFVGYTILHSELEECLANAPEIIRCKHQMRSQELALVSNARERIHELFQQLNIAALKELDDLGEGVLIPPEVLLEAGLLAFDEDDPVVAWEYLNELIEHWDQGRCCQVLQRARALYGKACLETHQYLEAVNILSEVVKEDPSCKEAYLDRAQAYFELGFFELAKSDFVQSETRLDPVDKAPDRLDIAVGLVDGITEGIGEALLELGPTLLSTAKGIGYGLWACATDPDQVSVALVDAALDTFEYVKDHSMEEIFDVVAPEISCLIRSWDSLSPQEKGAGMGRIIGRFGTDIFACEGVVGLTKKVRALKHLDACATLETVASKGKRSELLIARASTYGERRTFVAESQALTPKPAQIKSGIYVLVDRDTGKIMRSGRTNNFKRRELEHLRDPELKEFRFSVVYRTDVYAEQRGLEQIIDHMYNPPLNRIRPISKRNSKRKLYEEAATQYLERIQQ